MSNYKNKNFFFVGSAIDGTDYTSDFIENNKWKFGWESREDTDQYQLLRTYYDQMNEGDYIVLKSSYTRKIDLPFPNPNNQFASVMRIKAVGIIQENIGDGHTVKVEWIKDYRTTNKEWYFNTSRETIWMLDYNSELSSQLIEFSLNNEKQDYNYFLNIEYWRNHFFTDDQYEEYKVGQDDSPSDSNFIWIEFYQELADKLLLYSSDRQALIKKIEDTYESIGMKLPKLEKDRNLIDIDPFTIFALFNKGITDANRVKIITGLKEEFSISADVPDSFNGIPVVNNMAATFYYFIDDREKNDIDNLWLIFTAAMKYDEKPSEESMNNFITAFDRTLQQRGIRWNLTMGLYWIRPKQFINLDAINRKFILNHDNLPAVLIDKLDRLNKMPDGEKYLKIIRSVKNSIENGHYKYENFPELSFEAWISDGEISETELEPLELSEHASKLISSKNIIFRGAPGTGKTYLARSMAAEIVSDGRHNSFDDLEDEQKKNIEFIQFHPSYDYTDFVEGFRPTVDEETNDMRYEVIPGVFKKFISRAKLRQREGEKLVFIIDEINRGEISKIFGELFFAIDPSYRGKQGAVKTQYASSDETNMFYVPDNVYIIGTMNDIDRSVESFDFAMRRRFRFIEITADSQIAMLDGRVDDYSKAAEHMQRLNQAISEVDGLNSHYHIGPSYFLKLAEIDNDYDLLWQDYLEPLLEEYIRGFFDEVSILSGLKDAYYGTHPVDEYEN